MAKHKNSSRNPRKSPPPELVSAIPTISVIIPLYNTEKYIGECLDSLLAQTLKNFEVIVVDDCSTDSSPAIVQSYAEKFGGRLKISRMVKNSGCAPLPRNKGLTLSRGEYIFFMDSDDTVTKTALAEMYALAKEHDADVVYCEKFFQSDANGQNAILVDSNGSRKVSEPTLEPDSLAERVKYIVVNNFWGTPWVKLCRRTLLLENELFFQKVRPCDDHLWSYSLFFHARRFLRVPNAVYIWRMSEGSATRSKKTPLQEMNRWLESSLLGLRWLDEMMDTVAFFKQNLDYRYAILEHFTNHMFGLALSSSAQSPPHEIYNSIRTEFSSKFGSYDVLIPVLCTIVNTQLPKVFISGYILQLEL